MPKLVALFLVFAGLAPGQVPEYAPAGTEAYTLDLELDGYVNGKMDPDRLMTVRGCQLERDAAYTYSLMLEAAEDDGIYLRVEDCYRSYWRQDAAYNRRCPITTVPVFSEEASGGRVEIATKEMRVCTGPPTARAGESNHGWGAPSTSGIRETRSLAMTGSSCGCGRTPTVSAGFTLSGLTVVSGPPRRGTGNSPA